MRCDICYGTDHEWKECRGLSNFQLFCRASKFSFLAIDENRHWHDFSEVKIGLREETSWRRRLNIEMPQEYVCCRWMLRTLHRFSVESVKIVTDAAAWGRIFSPNLLNSYAYDNFLLFFDTRELCDAIFAHRAANPDPVGGEEYHHAV